MGFEPMRAAHNGLAVQRQLVFAWCYAIIEPRLQMLSQQHSLFNRWKIDYCVRFKVVLGLG